jgi:Flp pilus assembly protein TadG
MWTCMQRTRSHLGCERGQALLETAFVLPIILLVSIGIFEFGRAYQTVQVMTNAAREGARVAVLPNATSDDVKDRVTAYLKSGQLGSISSVMIDVDQAASISIGTENASASTVTVRYPFEFMVIDRVVNLVTNKSKLGEALTLTAKAQMRNESN